MAHINELRLGLGLRRELNYGRNSTLEADYVRTVIRNREASQLRVTRDSDATRIGRGDEFDRDLVNVQWDARRTVEFDMSAQMLAWMFAFGLQDTPHIETAENEGQICANAAQYLFSPPLQFEADRQAFSFSWVEKIGSAGYSFDRLYRGGAITRMSISGESLGRPVCRAEIVGSGKVISNQTNDPRAGLNFDNMVNLTSSIGGNKTQSDGVNGGLSYLFNAQLVFRGFDAQATPATFTYTSPNNLLRTWNFEWVNNLLEDQAYFPGGPTQDGSPTGGGTRGRLEIGDRQATIRFRARLKQGSPEYETILYNRFGAVDFALEGHLIPPGTGTWNTCRARLRMRFPRVAYEAADIAEESGIVVVDVVGRPLVTTAVDLLDAEQVKTSPAQVEQYFQAVVTMPKWKAAPNADLIYAEPISSANEAPED